MLQQKNGLPCINCLADVIQRFPENNKSKIPDFTGMTNQKHWIPNTQDTRYVRGAGSQVWNDEKK